MFPSSVAGRITRSAPLLVILLAVGCANNHADQLAATSTSAAPSMSAVSTAPAPTSAPTSPAPPVSQPTPSETTSVSSPTEEPAVTQACTDDYLTVTAGPVESADTTRRVVVTFTNTASHVCALVGYPGADLVTAAGGVLIHVARRPANAAPRLTLHPGEAATADVQSSAIDTTTGDSCGRIGTLVVIPPNDFQSHLLEANLPICDATISSVG